MKEQEEREPYRTDGKRTWWIAVVLCIAGFFGIAGIHRFYVGKWGTGLVYLFTLGVFYIGTILDLVAMLDGRFACKDGEPLYK